MLQKANTYAHRRDTLDALQEVMRIPSVSTLPEHATDMQQAAEWLARMASPIM